MYKIIFQTRYPKHIFYLGLLYVGVYKNPLSEKVKVPFRVSMQISLIDWNKWYEQI